MELTYIAAPYSHEDPEVVKQRMEIIYGVMAFFSKEKNMHVTTPLFMHELVERRPMPSDFEFWQTYCLNLLKRCDRMVVLKIDGWEKSSGVAGEIEFCKMNNIPVDYWDINVIINEKDIT